MVIGFEKIKLDGVKAVLLDFDNTLYDYDNAHNFAIFQCYKHIAMNINISEKEFFELYNEARTETHNTLINQAASHSRLLYFQKFFECYYNRTMYKLSLDFEEYYWSNFLNKMMIYPEAKDFLENLKRKSIDVCIVTDLTAQIQKRKIINSGLESYINFMVSSEEAGVEKPNPKIFKLALQKLNKDIHEVIMVGDNLIKDIEGASQIGIKSYLIENA